MSALRAATRGSSKSLGEAVALEFRDGTYYVKRMSTKELAMETIRRLPEDTSWEDIQERIRFLAAIEKSREEVRRGEVVPHEEVRDLLQALTTG